MNVRDFEDKVWEKEGIRVVVRAPSADNVQDYKYNNSGQGGWRITQLLEKRIQPKVGEYEVMVIEGNGEEPHGRTILRTLRDSYRRS